MTLLGTQHISILPPPSPAISSEYSWPEPRTMHESAFRVHIRYILSREMAILTVINIGLARTV